MFISRRKSFNLLYDQYLFRLGSSNDTEPFFCRTIRANVSKFFQRSLKSDQCACILSLCPGKCLFAFCTKLPPVQGNEPHNATLLAFRIIWIAFAIPRMDVISSEAVSRCTFVPLGAYLPINDWSLQQNSSTVRSSASDVLAGGAPSRSSASVCLSTYCLSFAIMAFRDGVPALARNAGHSMDSSVIHSVHIASSSKPGGAEMTR